MAKEGLYRLLCAGVLCAIVSPVRALPPDEEAKIKAALRIQKALEQGKEHLQRGE